LSRGEAETVGVSALMIAYNWPKNTERCRRLVRRRVLFEDCRIPKAAALAEAARCQSHGHRAGLETLRRPRRSGRNNDLAQKRTPVDSRAQFQEFIRARGFQNAVMTKRTAQ